MHCEKVERRAQRLAARLSGAPKAGGRDRPQVSPGRPGRARFFAERHSKGPPAKSGHGPPGEIRAEPATKPGGAGG